MSKGSRWRFAWSWCVGAVLAVVLPSCGGFPWPVPIPTPPPVACTDCDALPAHTGLVGVLDPVADSYIAVLQPPARGERALGALELAQFASSFKGVSNVRTFSRALYGFAATVTDQRSLAQLVADKRVRYVVQNGRVTIPKPQATLASTPWHLDRLDQRDLPLSGSYSPDQDGSNVAIYVLDTGCPSNDFKTCRQDHPEFGARLQAECYSTVVLQGCHDAHGHGTFVAAEAAGAKYGVCKNCKVYSWRFLDANGSGDDAGAVEMLDRIAAHDPGPGFRKVNTNSWGGGGSPAVDEAICRLRAAGVVVSNAAGNDSEDSCAGSPARVKNTLTVGASDKGDAFAYFSSYGPNVDLTAPGVDVESATPSGGSTTMSGTSMATPLVAGAAALYLQRHPNATPDEVVAGLVAESTPDKLKSLPGDTPNRLLYVQPKGAYPGGTPPKGTRVGAELLLQQGSGVVTDPDGKTVFLNQGILCCRTPVVPAGAKPKVRRPRPVWVKGVEINARWPCIGPEAMDFLHGYLVDDFHCRLGPFYADEETESDFLDIGGPYLADGSPNPAFWQFAMDQAWHAYKLRSREEVVPLDSWAFKFSQAGNRYVPWPQDVIDAFGHVWRPEFDGQLQLVAEHLGCYGNVYIAFDNEGTQIQDYDPEFYRTMLRRWRFWEQEVGCGFRHPVGTSIPALFNDPDIDYTITHSGNSLIAPVAGKWRVTNEHNPAFPPSIEESRFRESRLVGLLWSLWRDDMEDIDFYDTLGRFKRAVEGGGPPPPDCSLGTPTARQMALRQPTIRVQRTVAGAGSEPEAGKWITGTPVACFGRDYYCQPGMNWPEACASPPCPGPVAPEGHPQRPACEAQFLEQPCPTFSQDRCTGTGEQCPITFDTYIVIDGVNQLHPANVAAGCREATYIKDPNGRLLSGEWWKATAHGKGYLRACNADGSVCGVSTFEVDQ